MGVLDVEGGGGVGGRVKIVVELMAAGGSLEAGADEAKLVEASVDGAKNGGNVASEEAGNEAAGDRVTGEGAGGGGIGGGGGELACALIWLNLSSKCLGRKERAVSRGGAAVGDGVEPLSDEGEGVGTREEEGVGEAGAVGRPAGVSCKVATPSGNGVGAGGGVVDEAGA